MPKAPLRINVPSGPDELIVLAKKVLARHVSDAAESPLKSVKGIAAFAALALPGPRRSPAQTTPGLTPRKTKAGSLLETAAADPTPK